MKKIIIIFFTVFILLPTFINSSLIEMENEFIKIIGDTDTARFIIKTTGGDPKLDSDQDSLLLYEDYPPTSFSTIRIDEKEYKFGDEIGMFTSRMMRRNDIITTVWNIRNIDIRQTLKIVNGPTTGNLDTVEILYDIINKDNREHDIGIRVMLDTYLGKEDGAPFRIPQRGNITEEKALIGDEVPEYWYSYDDLSNPSVIAQGTLRIQDNPPPDKIIFTSWERFNKYLWDFTIKPGRSFRRSIIGPLDSALAMYWSTGKLKPNENYTIKTYYGLMAPEAIPTDNVFNITLGGPTITKGESIKVTADIKNICKYKIKNVQAEMILPAGLKFNFNENKLKNLSNLKKKQTKNISWRIMPDKSKKGIMTIKIKVTGKIKNKDVSQIVERKIEYKTVIYTLFDFSKINKIIQEINDIQNVNNSKLDEINQLLTKQINAQYSKKESNEDRVNIKKRIKSSDNLKKQIPDAIKTATKKEER